jgi:hypothetical protein
MTMTTETEQSAITLWTPAEEAIASATSADWHAHLILDPENRTLEVVATRGNSGVSFAVFHRRHLSFSVPAAAWEPAVHAWCSSHMAEFAALCDCYRGKEWDGNNHVGRWSDEAEELETRLDQALEGEEFEKVWSADSWFAQAWSEVGKAASEAIAESEEAFAALVASELHQAAGDAHLDEDDAYVTLRAAAADWDERNPRMPKSPSPVGGWIVPPECQGQIVTWSFATCAGGYLARVHDSSDGEMHQYLLTDEYAPDDESWWDPVNRKPEFDLDLADEVAPS